MMDYLKKIAGLSALAAAQLAFVAVTTETELGVATPDIVSGAGGAGGGLSLDGGGAAAVVPPPPPHPAIRHINAAALAAL
jgi:hypothetical protein